VRALAWLLLVLGALLSTVAGCSQPGEKLLPVSGRITVDGRPLTFGSVAFRPDASRGNTTQHHPIGQIDSAGNYVLYTLRQKGAPPGWYKVLVFADENNQGGATHPVPPRWATHARYTREETTDIFVEVVDNPPSGAYDLRSSR
jgi:hypothetical protein